MAKGSNKVSKPVANSELCRDIYGFTIRPQHLQRYKQYADIYKEEEAERSARWERFLATYSESEVAVNTSRKDEPCDQVACEVPRNCRDGQKLEMWGRIRQSLWPVEQAVSFRFKKVNKDNSIDGKPTDVSIRSDERNASEDESDDEFFDTDRNDPGTTEKAQAPDAFSDVTSGDENAETPCPWKEELDALVQGGVPMALRGEVWQVFVGTKNRRIAGHYQALLTLLADGGGDSDGVGGLYKGASNNYTMSEAGIFEKWTNQIEKDLPRTFPGHPALDEDGRNALRRLLTAYARHNPDVGYCQAMNFFAALLLLMMPEENAFCTLTGFIDDYFEGYYSEKMLESQVDQLVLDELVRRHFPRLVSHLDALGVQVSWVTGPWFLSIFVNILPWESVLRVWDVILYEGNRSMLFRTALALLEQHGSAIMTTKDAGDAVTMLQSLAGSTFDSSQLVLMACMGYQSIKESQLQELRSTYRPQVLAALSERSVWNKSKRAVSSKVHPNHGESRSTPIELDDDSCKVAIPMPPITDGPVECEELDDEESCIMDLMEQVKWLKMELSRAVVESRAANLRADELENAFMELVKEDNRRLLSAKVEALENEVNELKEALAEKEKQEQTMIKVMLQMEQDQRLADDARRRAEEDAAAQRHSASILQLKYEEAIKSLAEMEKRTVMAETMLEATLQYQALDGISTAGVSRQCIDAAEKQEAGRWSWSLLPAKSPKPNVIGSTSGTVADTTEINDDQMNNKNAETQASAGGTQKTSWRFNLGRREGKG